MLHDEQQQITQLARLKKIVEFLIQSFEKSDQHEKSEVMRKIQALLDDELVT